VAYASVFAGDAGARVGPWLMALGVSGLTASVMALGALRGRSSSRTLAPLLVAAFAVIFASLAAGLILAPALAPGARLLFGLPLPAAIVVYGVGIVPLLVLPIVYARTFDESRLNADGIRRRAAEIVRENEARTAIPSIGRTGADRA
jgi:hypothetical protein